MKDNPNALKCQRKSFNPPSEPAILNYRPCAADSTPRLKYKLSKVNYAPTLWGLVSHLSTCQSPSMPHASPAWEGGGFQRQGHWKVRFSNDKINNGRQEKIASVESRSMSGRYSSLRQSRNLTSVSNVLLFTSFPENDFVLIIKYKVYSLALSCYTLWWSVCDQTKAGRNKTS